VGSTGKSVGRTGNHPQADPDRPTIAAVQMRSPARAVDANIARIVELTVEATEEGVQLAVFPECSVTGYGYDDVEAVQEDAISLDDARLDVLRNACASRNINIVVGLIERNGNKVYNTSVLIDRAGSIAGHHRKLHLPCLGADRFVSQGDIEPASITTNVGQVGLLVCADMIFPEAARVCALKGAEIIAISACVPRGIRVYADSLIRVRAYENCVFVAFADGVGEDGAWTYDGRSQIADPSGAVIAQAPEEGDHIISVQANRIDAREKVKTRQPRGGIPHPYEVDFFGQRRPEMYSQILAPKQ
jgi:predicted amidohydrolase